MDQTFIGLKKHLVFGQFSYSLIFIGHHQSANLVSRRYPSRLRNDTRLADESYEVCGLGHHLGSTFTGMDRNGWA